MKNKNMIQKIIYLLVAGVLGSLVFMFVLSENGLSDTHHLMIIHPLAKLYLALLVILAVIFMMIIFSSFKNNDYLDLLILTIINGYLYSLFKRSLFLGMALMALALALYAYLGTRKKPEPKKEEVIVLEKSEIAEEEVVEENKEIQIDDSCQSEVEAYLDSLFSQDDNREEIIIDTIDTQPVQEEKVDEIDGLSN